MDEVQQSHAEEVGVGIDIFQEIANSLITDVKAAKAVSAIMSVGQHMILVRFEDFIRDLTTLVSANVEPKVKLTDTGTIFGSSL